MGRGNPDFVNDTPEGPEVGSFLLISGRKKTAHTVAMKGGRGGCTGGEIRGVVRICLFMSLRRKSRKWAPFGDAEKLVRLAFEGGGRLCQKVEEADGFDQKAEGEGLDTTGHNSEGGEGELVGGMLVHLRGKERKGVALGLGNERSSDSWGGV